MSDEQGEATSKAADENSPEPAGKYERLGKGLVKRTQRRTIGLFIDGTGLDRAARRLNRRVDMAALVRGVTSGTPPVIARYYTLIPYEDDSRQRAFLDAIERAGLEVAVKRLPPKGITRQVAVDTEMAADMVAFALGFTQFLPQEERSAPSSERQRPTPMMPFRRGRTGGSHAPPRGKAATTSEPHADPSPLAHRDFKADDFKNRVVTVVCPSRDLGYPIGLIKHLGVDTVTADFGQFNSGDVLKSAAKWIDLSDSETIWLPT